ncbi:hypothetical protein Vretimale_12360 [Volvox reticuliferus]|uniref:MARVEL domain-containing protein n=1 Tax=Volvox reticuliferus TaxID=1737510 RepID=A0A8J4GJK2_9CHLO|nr:hypothetical protein Vretifemale_8993 [Volvox reticuliferus]GIM08319.1 hypothetical protein Vretimale_12360 [Volvox reticuliferus]
MGLSIISKALLAIMSILRVGLALAIIIITAKQLYHISFYLSVNDQLIRYEGECLMAGSVHGEDVCSYTYAVCGLSLLLSLITSILLCITCDMCGAGSWLEFVVEGFQTAWWIVAGIVISKKVKDSNDVRLEGDAKMPKTEWRNAVAVMTWVAALLSLLIAFVYLTESLAALAKCLGCCGYKKKDKKEHHKKGEARQENPPAIQAPPSQSVGKDEPVRANAV